MAERAILVLSTCFALPVVVLASYYDYFEVDGVLVGLTMASSLLTLLSLPIL